MKMTQFTKHGSFGNICTDHMTELKWSYWLEKKMGKVKKC